MTSLSLLRQANLKEGHDLEASIDTNREVGTILIMALTLSLVT